MAFFWSFLHSPTTPYWKPVRQIWDDVEEGTQLALPLSLSPDMVPALRQCSTLWRCHTRRTLLPQLLARYKSRYFVKHSCCLSLTKDPSNHLNSCYTMNTLSSTLTLSYKPSSNHTNLELPCKHTKKCLCVPMSVSVPISVDYDFWKVEHP